MILSRLGNKQRIANNIIKYFPTHEMYIEPFFGAGGLFFNKPKVQYNILNDNDSEVFNLFQVVTKQRALLEKSFYEVPIHSDLLKYWQKTTEADPILKAVRFLYLSNFGYLGSQSTLKIGFQNHKKVFSENIELTYKMLLDVQFTNYDFRKFLNSFHFRHGDGDRERAFIYADPPYLNTTNNYSKGGFTTKDSIELFEFLINSRVRFAISEFDSDFILQQAKDRNLNIITIGERQNLKNKRTEILITNYEIRQLNLFE